MDQSSGMSALEILAAIHQPLHDAPVLTPTLVDQEVRKVHHEIQNEEELSQRIAEVFKMAEWYPSLDQLTVTRLTKASGRGTKDSIESNRLDQQSSVSTLKATPQLKITPANTSRSSKNPKLPTTQDMKSRLEDFTAEEKTSNEPPTTIELLKLRGGMGIYWEKTMSATTMDKLRQEALRVERMRRMSSGESRGEKTVRFDMSTKE